MSRSRLSAVRRCSPLAGNTRPAVQGRARHLVGRRGSLVRGEPLLQALLQLRPLRRNDREARRVARREVGGETVRPQHAFELRADARQRLARALVAHVGVEAHAVHAPRVERVAKHQQLRLGVGGGAYRRGCKPGVADLAAVGAGARGLRVARGPRPALDEEEARRADDGAVGETHGRKGERGAGFAPGERGVDVLRHLHDALRNGRQAIQPRVLARRRNQSGDVRMRQWLEAYVPAGEDGRCNDLCRVTHGELFRPFIRHTRHKKTGRRCAGSPGNHASRAISWGAVAGPCDSKAARGGQPRTEAVHPQPAALSDSSPTLDSSVSGSPPPTSMKLRRSAPSIFLRLEAWAANPVPAGINRPTMTFSLRPRRSSLSPRTAASVSTRVVSWNEAAEMNDSVASDALVIPSSTGCRRAVFLPSVCARSLMSSARERSSCSPRSSAVSPTSCTSVLRSIWRMITSMCLSLIFTPCRR